MKQADLAESIMRSAGLTKANVNRFYRGLVDLVRKELVNNGECVLPGLGILRVRIRKAREGRNPRTGERIHIPRRKGVSFKPYKDVRELLNPGLKKEPPEPAPEPEPEPPTDMEQT